MSDRDVRLYLNDILDSAKAILAYTKDLTYQEFTKDRKTWAATIREFEVIGEAVGKLPRELKRNHPDIRWQDIKDFRNLLAHEYFGIDLEIVWKIIKEDPPGLVSVVKEIYGTLNGK